MKRVVRHGPFDVPAATATDPGMIHNQWRLAIARPCIDCHITAMKPDLV